MEWWRAYLHEYMINNYSGTAGLGTQAILLLAAHNPDKIYFTGRSTTKANEVISDVKTKFPSVSVTFIELDLASLSSVQDGAKIFLAANTRLDKLICNAGVAALPPGLTKDGYELQFGTNHMGHALLVKLLLPTLTETTKLAGTDVRVVFLSSEGYSGHPSGGIIFKDLKTTQNFAIMGPWQRYGQSKLANVLYPAELARRYKDSGIKFLSIHPGVFNTSLIKDLPWGQRAFLHSANAIMMRGIKDETKNGQGAWNTCWAATATKTSNGKDIVNGEYYSPVGEPVKKLREGNNAKLAGQLYDYTEKELASWN
ncbi:dehydrogenase with different specificitie [Mollisia scopiformis]|uniref:Dehydrogenase with different specificitie n=1 Tax=Mollisia scopiformis TaxID=149040 RepID=A0A194XWR9_MOLSC|nr:dehydrogenase with different specificitie [Mollisia scopiformis]KUJ24182.1 dehydrogenase with different specificitie [Mollisia scopiformis]